MKSIYKIPLTFTLAFLLFMPFSCTDGFEELNTNPKLVTDDIIKPELLLTKVLKESAFEILDDGSVAEFSQYIKRGDSGQPLNFANFGTPFNYYTSHIRSLEAIIRLTAEEPSLANKHAIARIWRVWVYHRMTDMYGDIPYSEVATSFGDIIYYPKYDTQESIYIDLLNELEEAADELSDDAGQFGYGDADVMFGSDPDSWRRFANSLRLRLAIRVRYADEALSQSHIDDVFSADLISSNAFNATVTSEGEDAPLLTNTNPLYQQSVNGIPGFGSAVSVGFTLVENLVNNNDPRMEIYLDPNPQTLEYVGGLINLTVEQKALVGPSARYDAAFLQAEYDFNAMLAAEVSFLRAEAVLANLANGDANALYREGIQLSMEQYGVDPADIATFLASPAGTLSGTEEEMLEMIIVQKYLALFRDAYEAFTEHRRTGYPRMWIGSDPAPDTDNAMPRRLAYPLGEYNLNPASVEEAAGRLGGDLLKTRVWWDAKAGLPLEHPDQDQFPPY